MNVKRAALSIVTCLLLSSCGGGSNTLLSEGGIGGSGISVGSITAFGSIWVNGVRYDVSETVFTRDGESGKTQDDYRLGEVVTVSGIINADGISGTAQMVEFDDSLEGVVSSIAADGGSIQVLGQTVRTYSQTIFHGFSNLTDLALGNVVEVSGHIAQGEIQASSITLKQAVFTDSLSELETKGTVDNVDLAAKTFMLNTLVVDYSLAELDLPTSEPVNGQYVEVKSIQALQGNLMIASEVEFEEEYTSFNSGQEVELEGLVTAYTSTESFFVSGQAVVSNANTRYENGVASDVQLGTFLEVEGYIDESGILVAEEVSLKQQCESEDQELEGTITSLDPDRMELTIGSQTVLVDELTILIDEVEDDKLSIQFSDLSVNDFIEVKGNLLSDGRILALKIERELPEDE